MSCPNTKLCSKCRDWKPLADFFACRSTADGLQYACKLCQHNIRKEKHALHPEVRGLKYREWLSKNAEKKRASRAEYNRKNREQNAAYTRQYRKENRLKYNASMRRQRRENFKVKLANNLHCRLWHALKRPSAKSDKVISATELVGCSMDFLKTHLESQFQPGMTWDNRGKDGWHIDHKRPCASFDLKDQTQQRECFHWSNLQVLWAVDNHRKGARL